MKGAFISRSILIISCGLIAQPVAGQETKPDDDETAAIKQFKDRGAKVEITDKKVFLLSLNKKAFGNDDMKLVRQVKSLRWLNLRGSAVTEDGLKHLIGMESLEMLDLETIALTPAGLKHLHGMKATNYIGFNKNYLNDKGFAELLENEVIQKVNTISGTGKFGRATSPANVTSIQLGAWSLSDEGLKQLKVFKSLQTINLEREQMTDSRIKALRENGFLHMIEYAESSENHLRRPRSDADVSYLRIMSPSLTDKGLKEFAAFTSLKTLLFFEANLTDTAMKEIAAMKSVETLWLNNRITNEGLKELPAMPNLKHLQLPEGSSITDAGMKSVAQIKTLESLTLPKTRITPAGLAELKGLKLNRLTLDREQITDATLQELRKADLLHTFSWAIGLKGARPASLEDVQYLHLGRSKVTDVGLRELTGMTSLKKVTLEHTKVTDDGIAELKKALPNVVVSR